MSALILSTDKDVDFEDVGGKGRDLLEQVIIFSADNHDLIIESDCTVSIPDFFIVPPDFDINDMSHLFEQAGKIGNVYAVRSSSILEDHVNDPFDGIFETELDVPLDGLAGAIQKVRKSATSDKARKFAESVNVELVDRMPVIVQRMVTKRTYTGIVYSMFPSPHGIAKVTFKNAPGYVSPKEQYIAIYKRLICCDGSVYADDCSPFFLSFERDWIKLVHLSHSLANIALYIEKARNHPVIMEFACSEDSKCSPNVITISPLQARRLVKFKEAEHFVMPPLENKNLIAVTNILNGTGDYTAPAFVLPLRSQYLSHQPEIKELMQFDASHPEGYVFVAPYLKAQNNSFDSITPNKKAVVAYSRLGLGEYDVHDLEMARRNGILYLNIGHYSFGAFEYAFRQKEGRKDVIAPIQTGEIVRCVSDGVMGYVFNMSAQ